MNNHCKQKHGVPALFSFFVPGLGQLVKGDVAKAFGIWGALIVCAFMSIVGIGLLMGLVVWIAQVYDAYNAWKTGNAWGNKLTGQENRFTGSF